jgi:hypothetical protein
MSMLDTPVGFDDCVRRQEESPRLKAGDLIRLLRIYFSP